MRYSSRGEDAGEGGIGGSRPRATGELQERRRLHPRRANRVDIARRGTRLFLLFSQRSFISNANGGSANGLRIRLSTYPFFFFPSKVNFFPATKQEGTENRARSQGSNPRLKSFSFPNPMIASTAAARARRNQINTARRLNALLTRRLVLF